MGGSFSHANVAMRPEWYGDDYAWLEQSRPALRQAMRTLTHMNCWHLAEYESAAMWDIYQREGRGVAVRSTWGALTESIVSDRTIYGGSVRYVDYTREPIPEGNFFDAFMCKRESFSHEKEARLITSSGRLIPDPTRSDGATAKVPESPVILVSVKLEALVEEVFVAPDSPGWIADVVSEVTSRYGFRFPVHQSSLAEDPIA